MQSFQERETSNSSGDQGTETAISLSRCVHHAYSHLPDSPPTSVRKGLYYHPATKSAPLYLSVLED